MNIYPHQKIQSLWLLRLGILLFLIGLMTGFIVPLMKNTRMGLSSHMEGILNGIFLIGIGLLWERLHLSDRMMRVTLGLLLYGTFANWLATFLAAFWGAGIAMPIAGNGMHGLSWQEAVVNFLLYSLSVAMVLSCILIISGLKKRDIV